MATTNIIDNNLYAYVWSWYQTTAAMATVLLVFFLTREIRETVKASLPFCWTAFDYKHSHSQRMEKVLY